MAFRLKSIRSHFRKAVTVTALALCLSSDAKADLPRDKDTTSKPSPFYTAMGILCIAASLGITYKIARLPIDDKRP